MGFHKIFNNEDTLSNHPCCYHFSLFMTGPFYDHSMFDVKNYFSDKILCDKATVLQQSIEEIQLLYSLVK